MPKISGRKMLLKRIKTLRKGGNFLPFTTGEAIRYLKSKGFSSQQATRIAGVFEEKHFDLMMASGSTASAKVRIKKSLKEKEKSLQDVAPKFSPVEVAALKDNLRRTYSNVRYSKRHLDILENVYQKIVDGKDYWRAFGKATQKLEPTKIAVMPRQRSP